MTVEENVMYGLRMEKVAKDEARRRAREGLAQVQLADLGGRRPAQLSGGQRQRVALARALVKEPRVLLLDEPLSALDRQIRGEMQLELKRLQHQIGITFVVVTHDQEEALTMADRIAVLREGRLEQVGTPETLYERPATRFVAGFLGDANFFAGEVGGDAVGPWRVVPSLLRERGLRDGDRAFVVVRPERLRLAPAGDGGGASNVLSGRVAEVAYLGTARKYVVDLPDGQSVHARAPVRADAAALTAGDAVVVTWAPGDAVVVPADGAPAPAEAPVHA
jgi:ABC-type Fe3+/spermidine/putrescine transport system ATPase subunit